MSERIYKDLPFRVCSYANKNLICIKYCKTKEEAINYFNRCVDAYPSDIYSFEIFDDSNSTLLFSTEE